MTGFALGWGELQVLLGTKTKRVILLGRCNRDIYFDLFLEL